MERRFFDFIVIGGGMAGSSAAYSLAEFGRVALLEQEAQPGYHATGRSAALFAAAYGNSQVRALTNAGAAFLTEPPSNFSDQPLLMPRGALYVAGPDYTANLEQMLSEGHAHVPNLMLLDYAQAAAIVPVILPTYANAAIYEPDARAIDVAALQQGYLKGLKTRNGQLFTNAQVIEGKRSDGAWVIETKLATFSAPIVINAAGAWADFVATRLGVNPLGLTPKRRTALTFIPTEVTFVDWPLVINLEETLYFKPESGALMVSPADQTPSPACDAQADELDIAICVDRLESFTTLRVKRIAHRWAGLRTFAPDHIPIAGFDSRTDGFFWLAGQGGSGIKMAPGLAIVTAALARDQRLPDDLIARGVSEAALTPARFHL